MSHQVNSRWAILTVFFAALAVRVLTIRESPVHVDEFFHILAARSWNTEGTFKILDGEYSRSKGFTILVGWFFNLFGVGVLQGRLPSMFTGAVLVAAVFAWLRRQASYPAAWVAASLLCLADISLHLSAFVRFYMLHALLFWWGSILVYQSLEESRRSLRVWMLLSAAVLIAGAWHLQVTTLIGIAALGTFVILDLFLTNRVHTPTPKHIFQFLGGGGP